MAAQDYLRNYNDHGLFVNQDGLVNLFSDAESLDSKQMTVFIRKNVDGLCSDEEDPTDQSIIYVYQYN